MKDYDADVYGQIVKKNDKFLRYWAEWLIETPSYGAILMSKLADEWFTGKHDENAELFPEACAMLARHFNGDAELKDLEERLQIKGKESGLCLN